jgi:hypothetical protein
LEVGSFSYYFDKPWFHTEERLAVVLIIPSSWGSQLGGHQHAIKGGILGPSGLGSNTVSMMLPFLKVLLGSGCFEVLCALSVVGKVEGRNSCGSSSLHQLTVVFISFLLGMFLLLPRIFCVLDSCIVGLVAI